MKIALVSDAWTPQVNGVVRTLTTTAEQLCRLGHEVTWFTPDKFRTVPCPSYPEIRLAFAPGRDLRRQLDMAGADAVHIATEGPLGWAARRWCLDRRLPFTTSFHTRFPDYLALRTGLPARLFWGPLRLFHRPATRILVATATLEDELRRNGLGPCHRWSRGVDLSLFRPDGDTLTELVDLPRPILLHVGRVAPEKNVEAFLMADAPGTKVVVGDGPALADLRRRYPSARFLGSLHGERLAAAYRSADVFVFPSRTDTFGLVMIEALASGTPVAAYPVPGPLDVITPDVGVLHDSLATAIAGALGLDRAVCAAAGQAFSWAHSTREFLGGLCQTRREERSDHHRRLASAKETAVDQPQIESQAA